ncbi:hypothetical protein Droror1_Dr00000396 [Drosera rotundifolia]
MSTDTKKPASKVDEDLQVKLRKIREVKDILGPLPEKQSIFCTDAAISRYLRARNWHVRKAVKMLKETLKWRSEYKPEEIRWEDVAQEADTGKVYRSNFVDKQGRTVLVLRPSRQNSSSTKNQIKYFVYCMENAILNLPVNQEQMVWLIDFDDFSLKNISVAVTRDTAHVLQEHYPERLSVAIMFNPPKIFEKFWPAVKPFLEHRTRNKVKFVYPNNADSMKILEELFDMDCLESCFGGNNTEKFDIQKYAERMKEDDKRMPLFWTKTHVTADTATDLVSMLSLDNSDKGSKSDAEVDESGGEEKGEGSVNVGKSDAEVNESVGDANREGSENVGKSDAEVDESGGEEKRANASDVAEDHEAAKYVKQEA